MPREELKRTLAELRTELAVEDDLDPEALALLARVRDDISVVLEHTSEVPLDHQRRTRNALEAAADRFEQDHPALSRLIGHLADTLTALGL